ncbi:MAG: 4Fe-4S binding protein [Bacteroidetes bacterium]|nr:4Fe-4S binding protein [Bacteroidota bacterium]
MRFSFFRLTTGPSAHRPERTSVLLIEIKPDTCDFCGCCVGVCPEDAIELQEASISIVEQRCTNCAKCVWVCPFEVLLFHNPNKAKAHETTV